MSRIEKHDATAWRARAAECRAIADTFQNSETREKMCVLAADYDRMEENTDRRAQQVADSAAPPETTRSSPVGPAP